MHRGGCLGQIFCSLAAAVKLFVRISVVIITDYFNLYPRLSPRRMDFSRLNYNVIVLKCSKYNSITYNNFQKYLQHKNDLAAAAIISDLTFLLVLTEPGEEEGDPDDEEDDEDPDAVDEHGLAVLVLVPLVTPDLLLQVAHARGRPRQHQDAGAEVLVHHQHPRPHRGGKPQRYF